MVNQHLKVFANVAYDLASANSNPQLQFSAPANSEDDKSSTLEIDGDNPLVTFEGQKLTALPYEASGLRLSIGAGYYWNKN